MIGTQCSLDGLNVMVKPFNDWEMKVALSVGVCLFVTVVDNECLLRFLDGTVGFYGEYITPVPSLSLAFRIFLYGEQ